MQHRTPHGTTIDTTSFDPHPTHQERSANGQTCLLDSCLSLLFCVLLIVGLTRMVQILGRRHRQSWHPTRQCSGQYRRRPGLIRLPHRLRDLLPRHPKLNLCTKSPHYAVPPNPATGSRPTCTTSSPVIGPCLARLVPWVCLLCRSTGHPLHSSSTHPAYVAGPSEPLRPAFRAHHQFVQRLAPARKRSFRRAQQRAVRDGYAWYKGQRHTPESLSIRPLAHTSRPATNTSSTPNTATYATSNFRMVTWNSGGLHAVRYQEFLGWLDQQADAANAVASPSGPSTPIFQLACLQETHWPQSSEYRYKNWTMIHSGSGSSIGGVLFAVSARLVSQQLVRHAEIIPGRVLHVRLETNPPIDVLGVYQVAWNLQRKDDSGQPSQPCINVEDLLQKRASVWQAVRRWLASVPKRNALYVIGDFNCTLMPSTPNVGTGIAHHTALVHKDQTTFQRIVTDYGLTAFNTWGKAGKSAQTFLRPPNHGVQIDFILGRLPGTPQARTAHAVPEAPVVHPTGMRHVPVVATVPLPKTPRTHRSTV